VASGVHGPAVYNFLLAALFEWGVALHDDELDEVRRGRKPWSAAKADLKRLARKACKHVIKDYVVWLALSGPSALPALFGSLGANVVRNVWSHAVIFCGRFTSWRATLSFQIAHHLFPDVPSNLALQRLVVLRNLRADRGDHLLDHARQAGTQQLAQRDREIPADRSRPYRTHPPKRMGMHALPQSRRRRRGASTPPLMRSQGVTPPSGVGP
jgi:fatty acid desaturase